INFFTANEVNSDVADFASLTPLLKPSMSSARGILSVGAAIRTLLIDIMNGQKRVEFVIAHRLSAGGAIEAISVSSKFPERALFDCSGMPFESSGKCNYFGASEASVVSIEPVS